MNTVLMRTIQELSKTKYFYQEQVLVVFDDQLMKAGMKPSDKQRKAALKKLYRTLSRLGYRKHVGEQQTVEIVRHP